MRRLFSRCFLKSDFVESSWLIRDEAYAKGMAKGEDRPKAKDFRYINMKTYDGGMVNWGNGEVEKKADAQRFFTQADAQKTLDELKAKKILPNRYFKVVEDK